METLGCWHTEAEKQISRIGRDLARSTSGTDKKNLSHSETEPLTCFIFLPEQPGLAYCVQKL